MWKKVIFTGLVAAGIIAAVHYYQEKKRVSTPEGRIEKLKADLREAEANDWKHARRIAEAQKNLGDSEVALDAVLAQVARKKAEVAENKEKLDEQIQALEESALKRKEKILALDGDVRSGVEQVTYDGKDFPIAKVKEKLVEEFSKYQTEMALLKKLRDRSANGTSATAQSLNVLERRVSALQKRRDAYQRQYDALKADYQRRVLRRESARNRIIELEARLLELRQEQARRNHPDAVENDQLAKIESQLKALEDDVDLGEKTIVVHDQFHPQSKVTPVETPTRNLDAEVERIREHFGTAKEQN